MESIYRRCPACNGEAEIDPGDPSGLQYVCKTCGSTFKITYEELYAAPEKKEPELPIDIDSTYICLTPVAEPTWLRKNVAWVTFKNACMLAGIQNPWAIINNDGTLDLASFFLAVPDNKSDGFITTMQQNMPIADLDLLMHFIARHLKQKG